MKTYGSLSLTASSPAQSLVEPFTPDDLKSFLRLEMNGTHDDDLNLFISAARGQAELLQGRDLVEKQWDLSLDAFPAYEIELRDPLVSVDLVKYRDSDGAWHEMTEGTDYIVDTAKHPGAICPPFGESWPSFTAWPSSAVLVRFTSGLTSSSPWWLDDGARVKKGMKDLISGWFTNRLPFVTGFSAINEYPFTVTACLSAGALRKVI